LKINKLTHHQVKNLDTNTQFYPRVINKTDIAFSSEEMTWLNKGPKYNLTHKGKYWLSNLALEAKTAITILPTHKQEQIRHQVAHNLQKLYKQHNEKHAILDTRRWNEYNIINQIKRKLSDAKAIITKTDKGNSTIIIYENDYKSKVQDFIANNNFTQLTHDVTNKLQ